MKKTAQVHSRAKIKKYSIGIITAASLLSVLPTEALAGCGRWDIACKIRERVRDAARRAADEARRQAENVRAQTEAAARRAEEESRRQAAATQALAETAAREAERVKAIAEAEAKKLAQQVMDEAIGAAFSELRSVGLDVLANAKTFTDPDLWLREITKAVMIDMAGQQVREGGEETVSYIKDQLGKFSESAPFGDGPVGRQIQAEVEKNSKKALQNVVQEGEKSIDYLNPFKNPILPNSTDFNIAKDMYAFDVPPYSKFSYGTSLQIKPIDGSVDFGKSLPGVAKGSLQSTFPLLWGDNSGASTIFVNAVSDNKFKFQVGAAFGVGTRKADEKIYSDDRKASGQGGANFDVTCSTVVLNMCQLTKISFKLKIEGQRKSNEQLTGGIKKAMASMLIATGYLETVSMLRSSDRARLDSVLRFISSTIEQPMAMIDIAEKTVLVSEDIANKALSRQADVGAVTYLFAAISATNLPSKKWQDKNWKKTTSLGKTAFSLSDIESAEVSLIFDWYNADSLNNQFKPGFSFIGGSNNPLPDMMGIGIGKKIGTEAKYKLGSATAGNETEVGMSATIHTDASFSVMMPLKTAVMDQLDYDYFKSAALNGFNSVKSLATDNFNSIKSLDMSNLNSVYATSINEFNSRSNSAYASARNSFYSVKGQVIDVTKGDFSDIIDNTKTSFGDRIGLGSSKNWDTDAELIQLESELELSDRLNVATSIAIGTL